MAVKPGVMASHATASLLTPLHEFAHALSSYSNGVTGDFYFDNTQPRVKVKISRPISGNFGI